MCRARAAGRPRPRGVGEVVRIQQRTLQRAVYDLLRSAGPHPKVRPTQGAGGEALPPRTLTQAYISALQPALARAPPRGSWRANSRRAPFLAVRRFIFTQNAEVVQPYTSCGHIPKGCNLMARASVCARRTATWHKTRRARPNHSQNRLILHAAAYCAEDPGAPWPRKPPAPRTHRTAAQPCQRPQWRKKSRNFTVPVETLPKKHNHPQKRGRTILEYHFKVRAAPTAPTAQGTRQPQWGTRNETPLVSQVPRSRYVDSPSASRMGIPGAL